MLACLYYYLQHSHYIYSLYLFEIEIYILRTCCIVVGTKANPADSIATAVKNAIVPESQNIVLADLDQMGTLVRNGLVPEKEFLEVYWKTVISCYEVLKEEEKTKLCKF
jgi:hypothetical protein